MKTRRVMVVEDNPDTVRTLVMLLKAEGHQVELGLPGLDGFEVCARLKREPAFQRTRFIAVSGYCKEEDRARSRASGCDAHLSKPADPKQLLALVGSDGPSGAP